MSYDFGFVYSSRSFFNIVYVKRWLFILNLLANMQNINDVLKNV